MKHVEACLKCQRRSRKQFSPRWRTCEVGASLFMCGKYLITPFSPPTKFCEVRGGLCKCQSISKRSCHLCVGPVRLVQACLCARKT